MVNVIPKLELHSLDSNVARKWACLQVVDQFKHLRSISLLQRAEQFTSSLLSFFLFLCAFSTGTNPRHALHNTSSFEMYHHSPVMGDTFLRVRGLVRVYNACLYNYNAYRHLITLRMIALRSDGGNPLAYE